MVTYAFGEMCTTAQRHSFLAEKNHRFAVAMLILYFKKDLGLGDYIDALPKLCAIIDG